MMWQVIMITCVFFVLLAFVSLHVRVGGAFYRGMTRCLCAVWALVFLSLAPGVQLGVSALSVLTVSALGLPGAVLLQVIALMP